MEEIAEVIAIDVDYITVASQVKSSCSSCSQLDTCGSGQIAKAIPHKKLSFTLPYSSVLKAHANKHISVGDCVVLSLPKTDVLRSAWQVYLLPLFGLLGFSSLGQLLQNTGWLNHELQALLLGLFGGYLGYRIAKFFQKNPLQMKKLQPRIVRVLPKAKAEIEIRHIS